MKTYTSALEHAATALIEAIYFEHDKISELEAEITNLLKSAEFDYARYQDLADDPELDDEGIGTASRWNAHFSGSEAAKQDQALASLKAQIASRKDSTSELSTALLQIAKRAMSRHFGRDVARCPNTGRKIGSQHLRDVVWQSRNLAIHYEDRTYSPAVQACFSTLAQEEGLRFDLNQSPHEEIPFHVVQLLGWNKFTAFAADVDSLIP